MGSAFWVVLEHHASRWLRSALWSWEALIAQSRGWVLRRRHWRSLGFYLLMYFAPWHDSYEIEFSVILQNEPIPSRAVLHPTCRSQHLRQVANTFRTCVDVPQAVLAERCCPAMVPSSAVLRCSNPHLGCSHSAGISRKALCYCVGPLCSTPECDAGRAARWSVWKLKPRLLLALLLVACYERKRSNKGGRNVSWCMRVHKAFSLGCLLSHCPLLKIHVLSVFVFFCHYLGKNRMPGEEMALQEWRNVSPLWAVTTAYLACVRLLPFIFEMQWDKHDCCVTGRTELCETIVFILFSEWMLIRS